MEFFVKVDSKVIDQLRKTVEGTDEQIASSVAETAYFHANYMLGTIPEEVKGKLNVQISEVQANEVEISYMPKAGAEASTFSGPKAGSESIFLPLSKLGGVSTQRPTYGRGGEEGIFISSLRLTGRPSIDAYLMKNVEGLLERDSEITLEFAMEKVTQDLKRWFAANGIVFNEGAGRYQATRAATLPTGAQVESGSFIVGAF